MKRPIVWLAFVALACNSPTGPFQVSNQPSSLRLVNGSSAAVFYIVIERDATALVDWIPCTNPSTCPQVTAHGEKIVPYSAIIGYKPDAREAVLYWWYLVPGPNDALQADSIRVARVLLGPGA